MGKTNTAQARGSSIRGLVTWCSASLVGTAAAPPRANTMRSPQQKHAAMTMPAGTLIRRSGRQALTSRVMSVGAQSPSAKPGKTASRITVPNVYCGNKACNSFYRYVSRKPRLGGEDESAQNKISILFAGMPCAVRGSITFLSMPVFPSQSFLSSKHRRPGVTPSPDMPEIFPGCSWCARTAVLHDKTPLHPDCYAHMPAHRW